MNNDNQPSWSAMAETAKRDIFVRVSSRDQAPMGDQIKLSNPADGGEGLDYRASSDEQVNAAVMTARDPNGGAVWWSMPAAARRASLLVLADLIESNAVELGLQDCLDIGKPISAAVMESHIAASMCRHFGELADKVYIGQLAPSDPGSSAMNIRKPRGVVGAIVPWNFPIINAVLKLAPALAAGNSVILKPSELSPGSAQLLARLCDEANIPPGTVSFLPGDGTTGAALAHHTGIDMLTFTGSTGTGKALMRAAGNSTLKPLLLECGGKSPEIVFDDVHNLDINDIAQAVVAGSMANQGQLCVARSRLYIQDSMYDELLGAIANILEAMVVDHPLEAATQFGPLASAAQAKRVGEFVESGVNDGARLVVDGRAKSGPNDGGNYVAPCLFAEVEAEMDIMRREIFGPVLCVSRFSTEDEAVALANASEYGLAATVWTTDLARSHRMIQRIETGGLQIRATAEQRFGAGWGREGEPYGQSGFGIEGGQLGVNSYTRVQWVQVDVPVG